MEAAAKARRASHSIRKARHALAGNPAWDAGGACGAV
jgi:hypothetical protein